MLPSGPYNPQKEEREILEFWLQNGFYKPEYNHKLDKLDSTEQMLQGSNDFWSLICPPPNAYSRPHIGNISGYAYQDAVARFARMKGKKVLMIPGKDHAGLEGEGVFVREVLEKQGRKKFDMTREDFYAEMMDFFRKNMDIARNDEKNIGLSADFDRDTFTLDPKVVDIVLDTFIEMYQRGMIYKGVRIVNWDPKARTAVADNQVVYEETTTPFYYFKYSIGDPVKDSLEIKSRYLGVSEANFKILDKPNLNNDEISVYSTGITDQGDELIAVGYTQVDRNKIQSGRPIGIAMGINFRPKLVVINNNFQENFSKELIKLQTELSRDTGGSHVVLFDYYPEDSYYTNGFVVGTVRPETIFADTAIACNPSDKRYTQFIGKKIEVEFLGKKKTISFISDYTVDQEFGTGLLKITPAHSNEDWEIAQRNREACLPPIQVIGYDLKMNEIAGDDYKGLSIKEARVKITQDMKTYGNLVLIDEEYKNKIKIAERTKAPIEPLLSSQWYLSYDVPVEDGGKTLREAAIDMVRNKEVLIHPKSMEEKFFFWMENLRDWAISRSLWWGYRLPVWYHGRVIEKLDKHGMPREYLVKENLSSITNSTLNPSGNNSEEDLAFINPTETPLEYSNPDHIRVQKDRPGEGWYQDESVLDTWFSSGQWVYATLCVHGLMDQFFPSDVMVSGFDILENWDSRMMMFTYFKYKTFPFKNLYLTGLVLGSDGQKMSKSRGNIVDIDKAREEFGTDAVRLVYFYQNTAGSNYSITFEKLKNFKQFCNKIWNASKYILQFSEYFDESIFKESIEFTRKINTHMKDVRERINKNIDSFQFGLATYNLYHEFWHTFCDILIEESKIFTQTIKDPLTQEIIQSPNEEIKKEVATFLIIALKEYLKLMHPFMPFITERIWQEVPKTHEDHKSIMYSKV